MAGKLKGHISDELIEDILDLNHPGEAIGYLFTALMDGGMEAEIVEKFLIELGILE